MDGPSPRSDPRSPTDQSARSEVESVWLEQIAQRGSAASAAFRRLTEVYGSKILAFCMRRGLSLGDAEDLLQDVCVTLYAKAAEFRQGATPSPWIWAIVRNRWIDALRDPYKARRDVDSDEEDGMPASAAQVAAPSTDLAPQAADDCVQRALQDFARGNSEAAMVVYLRDLEGWAIKDVAEYLERTEGATRQYLSEVRKKLRPFLEPCLELLST
jgi:RNA polymerase sigma-70 factor, ECF subfamily